MIVTLEEAERLLNPVTTADEIYKIKYYGGFKGEEKAITAIEEACIIACNALREKLNLRNDNSKKRLCKDCDYADKNDDPIYCCYFECSTNGTDDWCYHYKKQED